MLLNMCSVILRLYPSAPADVKVSGTPTVSSAVINWTVIPNAKAYIVRYGVNGVDAANDRLHYTETPNFTINDTVFAGTLKGLKLNVYVASLQSTYTGVGYDGATAEIKKANEGMAKEQPKEWSTLTQITYPNS